MIRVLVVDDSRVSRELLTFLINSQEDMQVVGTAATGLEAVEKVARLRPDAVTMDIIMPVMNGYESTRRIMHTTPVPIIVVSASFRAEEMERSFRALEAGALAVVDKPGGPGDPQYASKVEGLISTVRLMSEVTVVGRRFGVGRKIEPREVSPPDDAEKIVKAVAIGASTGGPKVLEYILGSLPGNYCLPLLVVQHIASGFTRGLADWLNSVSAMRVCVATHDEPLRAGRCYLAPSGLHMEVTKQGMIVLSSAPPEQGLRPSINLLFRSVAESFGHGAVGVLLTGMGADGASGMKAIREQGGATIAQDPNTAVLPGMPSEAVAAGAVEDVLAPEGIVDRLVKLSLGNRGATSDCRIT